MLEMLASPPTPEQLGVEIRQQEPYPRELNIFRPDPLDSAIVVRRYEEGENEFFVVWSGHALSGSGIVAAQVFPSAREAEIQAIMGGLVSIGQDTIADRISQLDRMMADEGERLDTTSLWLAADFLGSDHGLGTPQIGTTPAGEMQAVWKVPGDALVVMDFLPGKLVRFAALSTGGQTRPHPAPPPISGVAEHPRAMGEIREFLARLESP